MANKGIGQYVEKWKISNPLFSPNPKTIIKKPADTGDTLANKNDLASKPNPSV